MEDLNAQVVAVQPNKIKIHIKKIEDFQIAEEKLRIGSYLRVADANELAMIATIENFNIEPVETVEGCTELKYVIEAVPLGMIDESGKFIRGGDTITIPPKSVEPANVQEIKAIFEETLETKVRFDFSSLSSNQEIRVPVDGNKFFNKHIAVVGSTGSGKSHTVAKIIQKAVEERSGSYDGLNNSHILIFDIHNEYESAFPNANVIRVSELILPFWLLNSEELQELFLDTEGSDHNQRNIFKKSIINSKRFHFLGEKDKKEKIHFDSPILFKMEDILKYAQEKNEEQVLGARDSMKAGPLNGKLSNYISRLEAKIYDKRLDFLLGEKVLNISLQDVLKQFIGYKKDNETNVTILDLSGVPFDVLSITVSLISRIMFEYGYYYKQYKNSLSQENDVPILLVFEEAHKYVPKSGQVKYRASRQSIEQIAKEGRKYGVTLLLSSQRPSEISETIFSQCSNFITMRLTNPADQSYVKHLLPDSMGTMIDKLPSLSTGEALLIGEATTMPTIVKVDTCDKGPSSKDILYFELWKESWRDIEFNSLEDIWKKK